MNNIKKFLLLPTLLFIFLIQAGCQTVEKNNVPQTNFHIESSSNLPLRKSVPLTMPISKVKLNINPIPVLSDNDIEKVALVKVDLGLCLIFILNPTGARKLYQLSAANRGKRLVLMIDDEPTGIRILERVINDGRLFTFTELNSDELIKLATSLKR